VDKDLVTVSVVMHPELARKLRIFAAIEGKSRSRIIREIVAEALSNNKMITHDERIYMESP